MKKQIIILLCLVLSAGIVFGGYPNGFYGDRIPEDLGVQAEMTQYLDRNPWSMPDPTGAVYWFGEVYVTGDVLDWVVTGTANRHCKESIFTPYAADCYAGPARKVAGVFWTKTFVWDNGIYIKTIWNEEKEVFFFESFTWNGNLNEGVYRAGTLKITNGGINLEVSNEHTFETWKVEPKWVEIRSQAKRRGDRFFSVTPLKELK